MNFEEILTAMTLDATDKQYLTVFTLTVLEGMRSKIHDYPDFKAFFEATIEYSKSIGQPIDFPKLRLIRESEPKKAKPSKKAAKEQGPWRPNGINPWQHMTFDDNIKRWEDYELSPEVQAYTNFFGHAMADKQRKEFIDKLNSMTLPTATENDYVEKIRFEDQFTAEQIANEVRKIDKLDADNMYRGLGYKNRLLYNWANKDYAFQLGERQQVHLKYIDEVRIRVGLEPRILPKFKLESIETKETIVEQPKTQEDKKDSTTVKFDTVSLDKGEAKKKRSKKVGFVIYEWSNGEVEYRHEPEVYEQLSKINVPQSEVIAILDEPTYNPFAEVEDVDEPVFL